MIQHTLLQQHGREEFTDSRGPIFLVAGVASLYSLPTQQKPTRVWSACPSPTDLCIPSGRYLVCCTSIPVPVLSQSWATLVARCFESTLRKHAGWASAVAIKWVSLTSDLGVALSPPTIPYYPPSHTSFSSTTPPTNNHSGIPVPPTSLLPAAARHPMAFSRARTNAEVRRSADSHEHELTATPASRPHGRQRTHYIWTCRRGGCAGSPYSSHLLPLR